MTYADNGFGELVPVANPFGYSTNVYMRIAGKLAVFAIATRDPAAAIEAVRHANNDHKLSRTKWRDGPCLAVITND